MERCVATVRHGHCAEATGLVQQTWRARDPLAAAGMSRATYENSIVKFHSKSQDGTTCSARPVLSGHVRHEDYRDWQSCADGDGLPSIVRLPAQVVGAAAQQKRPGCDGRILRDVLVGLWALAIGLLAVGVGRRLGKTLRRREAFSRS